MKVIVTGHQGYIGTIMVPMLISRGHEVVGIDSNLYENSFFGEKPLEIKKTNKDIRDITLHDLQGFDAIIHLAALSNDPLGDINPELTYEINLDTSVRLAELAKRVGITRFIFSSTCSVYGSSSNEILTETSETNPVTPYAISKLKTEKEISKLADENFTPTFLRSGTAYGISPKLRSDLVLNNLTAWAYTTGNVLLKSNGKSWRPIVHIEDISKAFIEVLNAPRDIVHNEVFNVGISNENYQISELAEIVKETVPNSKVEYAEGAGPDKRTYRVDFSKISNRLPDYKPKWDARAGVRELYDAYKKYDLTVEDFDGPRYVRIKKLKKLMESGRLDSNLRWIIK